MTFKLVKSLDGYAGDARVYHVEGFGNVMVSRAYTLDHGDETMIFKWNRLADKVENWTDLYAGYGETHEEALTNWRS